VDGPLEVIAVQSDPRPEEPIGAHKPGDVPPPWSAPVPPGDAGTAGAIEARRRTEAIKRLEKRRGWTSGLVAYVVVNVFLVWIWASTGRGYFWPGWVIGGWGMGMVLSFWEIFVRRPISEADIEAEMHRRTASS
jgi:hypothetical protein